MEIYWVISGMFLLPGIVIGIYEAIRQVYGYTNVRLFGDLENSEKLGFLPTVLIQTILSGGTFSLIKETAGLKFSPVTDLGIFFLLSLWQVGLREIADHVTIIVSGFILCGGIVRVIGGAHNMSLAIFVGVVGGIVSAVERLFIQKIQEKIPQANYHVFPFWISALLSLILFFIIGPLEGIVVSLVIALFFTVVGNYLIPPPIFYIRKITFFSLAKFLIYLRDKTGICTHCFRYTHPLKSIYRSGRRYCEHCQQKVKHPDTSDKLKLVFGELSLQSTANRLVFVNPDVKAKIQPIDVSEVYIDTSTCNRVLLERFITYILTYPPKHGRRSVKFFHYGDLNLLGDNLKNALCNNFDHIAPIPTKMLSYKTTTGLPVQILLTAYHEPLSCFWEYFRRPLNKGAIIQGLLGGMMGALWGLSFVVLVFSLYKCLHLNSNIFYLYYSPINRSMPPFSDCPWGVASVWSVFTLFVGILEGIDNMKWLLATLSFSLMTACMIYVLIGYF